MGESEVPGEEVNEFCKSPFGQPNVLDLDLYYYTSRTNETDNSNVPRQEDLTLCLGPVLPIVQSNIRLRLETDTPAKFAYKDYHAGNCNKKTLI